MTSETLSVPVLTAEDIANAKIRDAASDLLEALRDCVESGTLAPLDAEHGEESKGGNSENGISLCELKTNLAFGGGAIQNGHLPRPHRRRYQLTPTP